MGRDLMQCFDINLVGRRLLRRGLRWPRASSANVRRLVRSQLGGVERGAFSVERHELFAPQPLDVFLRIEAIFRNLDHAIRSLVGRRAEEKHHPDAGTGTILSEPHLPAIAVSFDCHHVSQPAS